MGTNPYVGCMYTMMCRHGVEPLSPVLMLIRSISVTLIAMKILNIRHFAFFSCHAHLPILLL